MNNWKDSLVRHTITIKESLATLNKIGISSHVLYVVNEEQQLLGSLTDGDIRRALLNNASLEDTVTVAMNASCIKVQEHDLTAVFAKEQRSRGIHTIPLVDDDGKVLRIVRLDQLKEILPVHAIVMAGGKGERLLPLTKETPKPLLKVGTKTIIDHNISRLKQFGISDIHVSVNYLADKIVDHFEQNPNGVVINFIHEPQPMGTAGALSLLAGFQKDTVLLMNSDLLTNIDFGDFYKEFVQSGADMMVATIPHHVDLPYAIIETNANVVTSLKEKPRYTYFANAGIYLFKKELIKLLPKGERFDATDLMEQLVADNGKLVHYPILGYWLDIGRMDDFKKAQEDIKHINW